MAVTGSLVVIMAVAMAVVVTEAHERQEGWREAIA